MATAFFLFLTVVFGVGCLVLTSILLGMRHEQREAKSLKRKSLNEIKTARFDQHNAREVISGCESIKADAIRATQGATDRVARMGSYIIAEQSGEHIKAIKANNYHAKEKKILRSIEVAAKNGYHLPADEQQQLTRMLKQAHEKALKAEAEKQKQAAIKEQMREEERAQREFDRAIKKAEEERKKKEREAQIRRKAMEDAIKMLGDTHSEQLDELKKQLADAEQEAEEARLAAERTKSMAEQTKRGHIYIISNIGSFGKDMYKVGMTRRLEPMDRVKELGDASVPFTFDVHAMISSDNAPSLESALHRRLSDYRVNRINFRKEFFRTPIETIIQAVEAEHGVIEYQADPEALEYFESLDIANESGTLEERITAEASLEEQN